MVRDMARPQEWRGSDLRSRTEVVQYLTDHGGVIEDHQGLAAGTMRDELGKGRALGQLLADMEADGMIRREIRGRRTFKIELLDGWGLAGKRVAPLRAVPASAESAGNLANLSAADLNYDELAQSLLTQVVKIVTEPVKQAGNTSGQRVLVDRLRKAEDGLRKANDQLKELRAEKRAADEARVEAERKVAALEHNMERLEAELSKPRRSKESGGVPIGERLSASERAALASLMRELPETPESKPRARRTR